MDFAETGGGGLYAFFRQPYACTVLDLVLLDISGEAVLKQICQVDPLARS